MEYRLKDCLEKVIDNRGKNPKYFDKEKYPVIDNVFIKNNYYINDKIVNRYINQETYDNFLRGYVEENMPIMTLVGSGIGNVGLIKNENVAIVQNTIGFKTKENLDSKYLYYWFLTKQNELQSFNRGSGQPSIKKTDVENMEIDLPDIAIQKKIVNILEKLDDKIYLNNQINDNLYELLKVEFKTRFYNKNSDAKLLDFISNTIGGDWGKELPVDNYNTKVYCVRGADIPNMEYGNKGNAPTRYILEKNYNNKKLKPNNIIVEISGGSPTQSTGRTAYITENILNMYDAPLLCTNFCRAIETKKNIYAPFVYMYLTLMYEDDIFFNWENGTTGIKNLALNDLLSNIEITQPNEEELNKYYILFNSIMNKISNNSNENIKLELLRDTLLPKLMNGEIDLDKIEI